MVNNKRYKNRRKKAVIKNDIENKPVIKIGANTTIDMCSEYLSAFGGIMSFVKFLDLIKFKEVFAQYYESPDRKPKLGNYRMVTGLFMLLFIGFTRLGHFTYIRGDSMLCGILKVDMLPAVSTFWRYLRSLGKKQSDSFLRIGGILRSRVWQICGINYNRIHVDIDTTVSTVYGDIENSLKGHNTKHRGKKGLRPVLCFISETREYLCGSQRPGKTMKSEDVGKQIREMGQYLPNIVRRVCVRGDGEFIGWDSVKACLDKGYDFILGNKRCSPPFKKRDWYRHKGFYYNECVYQPTGWNVPCRFVVMRILKEEKENKQLSMFDDNKYKYRIFVTCLKTRPHNVIREYDGRAGCEPLIGESQREGINAIPSKKFEQNLAYFQIVMLGYNLWRWIKLIAGAKESNGKLKSRKRDDQLPKIEIVDNTIRIARLKMLFVPAKIISHSNRNRVCYSSHDSRSSGMIDFLKYLDKRRNQKIKWRDPILLTAYKKAA